MNACIELHFSIGILTISEILKIHRQDFVNHSIIIFAGHFPNFKCVETPRETYVDISKQNIDSPLAELWEILSNHCPFRAETDSAKTAQPCTRIKNC